MHEVPDEITALAVRRAAARVAKDFATSDALRDELADAGWLVRDTPGGYELTPAPPYPLHPHVGALVATVGDPEPAGRVGAVVLVTGYPADAVTCVQALVEHGPPDLVVTVLEAGDADGGGEQLQALADAWPDRVVVHHVEAVPGWSAGITVLLRLAPQPLLAVLDPSSVLTGDALTPLVEALDDGTVVAAGWRGVDVDEDWLGFHDAGPGETDALLGYLFVVRRESALATPPAKKATFYRNADMEWSFALRAAGRATGGPYRTVMPVAAEALPVRQGRHHGYHDSDPQLRDRESKKTYDRFLAAYRGKPQTRA